MEETIIEEESIEVITSTALRQERKLLEAKLYSKSKF